jgi:hypothetical protein
VRTCGRVNIEDKARDVTAVHISSGSPCGYRCGDDLPARNEREVKQYPLGRRGLRSRIMPGSLSHDVGARDYHARRDQKSEPNRSS